MPLQPSILVVDPFELARSAVCAMLAGQRYDVTAVERGEDALALLRHAPRDLVLTEVSMPGLSGGALLREIRRTAPRARVAAMSAYLSEPLDCAAPFLAKPFTHTELLGMVRSLLKGETGARRHAIR